MKKQIEFLFSDLCNIYAESYNIEYLSRCSDEVEITYTKHNDVPAFVNKDVDMIYIGCLTERKQEMAINLLRPYAERITECIDDGVIFLATGNSLEIFGKQIEDAGSIIDALGIFDYKSVRYMEKDRHNSQYVGRFVDSEGEEITMLGHRSQFSFSYGEFQDNHFIDIEIGIGMNPDIKLEGIHYNNFFATYSLGPYLIMNPLFTKYILRKLNVDDALLFEKEAIEAYEYRRDELKRTLV